MDFWNFFWLLLIYVPLLLIWGTALVDIFRRDDLSGWGRAAWVVTVLVLPFLGTLIYLIARPTGATKDERAALDEAGREFVARYSPDNRAEQLRVIADLHTRGYLSDEELTAEKARIMGAAPVPAPRGATTPSDQPSTQAGTTV